MAKKDFGCGRKECGVSSGICGRTTFGTGELDFYGYWQHPCKECISAWKEENKIIAEHQYKPQKAKILGG